MAKYLDTGAKDRTHSLGYWLDVNLSSGIQEFHAQFAYFTYTALKPYAEILKTAVLAGFPVHIVLGSNERSLVADDLRQVLKIVENAANASLTVVAYSNAKFHPKTVQIVRPDNSSVAVVGSGNLTHRGLGWNVEAGIVLDSTEGDDASVIKQVANAIDRWRSLTESGVFPIRSETDINALLSAGIISVAPLPRLPSTSLTTRGSAHATILLGSRQPLWKPSTPTASIAVPSPPSVTIPATRRRPRTVTSPAGPVVASVVLPPQKWYKQMPSSDAQQVRPGTNPTGKLRLTKSVFPIDKTTFFRYDLFGSATWRIETRNGLPYEIAELDFDVSIHGSSLGNLTLTIDHAPHRISGQANIPTVLAWGTVLGSRLTAASYVDEWVVIERDMSGAFSLAIQANQP